MSEEGAGESAALVVNYTRDVTSESSDTDAGKWPVWGHLYDYA